MSHLRVLSCIALLTLSAFPAPGDEPKTFHSYEPGMRRVAEGIADYIRKHHPDRARKIVIGQFVPKLPSMQSSGGTAIVKTLTERFKDLRFDVVDRGPFQLDGKYRFVQEKVRPFDRFESVVMQIDAVLMDADGETLNEFTVLLQAEEKSLQIAGANVALSPELSTRQKHERLREAIRNPDAAIEGPVAKAQADSQFAIELLMDAGGGDPVPLLPKLGDDRRPYVGVKRGDEVIVRLHNRAPFECAVMVTVDGLEWDAFAADGETGRMVIVPPAGSVDVSGWYETAEGVRTFAVTGYPESAAKLRNLPEASVGTISAAFHACWPEGEPPPDSVGKRDNSSRVGIGLGKKKSQSFQRTSRTIGSLRSIVSVRYRK